MDDDKKEPETIKVPSDYYVLGDGTLYARHLFRRIGSHVKLVAVIIDEEAAEKIVLALQA